MARIASSSSTSALLLVFALPALALLRVSPSVSLKGCDEPKVPLGIIHAQGVLTYNVLPNGRADTATVAVIAVNGMSAAGFRSVATRLLMSCTFRIEGKETGPIPIFEQLRFDSTRVRYAIKDSISVSS